MKLLLISISLTVLVFLANGEMFLMKFTAYANSTVCKHPGYACRSCSEAVFCIDNGWNYTEISVETCNSSTTCLNGSCTTRPNLQCHNTTQTYGDFMCRTPGIYPDPFDCKKYHYCIKTSNYNSTLQHFKAECDCNYGYNPYTTFCDEPLRNSTCSRTRYPLANCTAAGDTGTVLNHPSLYYLCQYHSKTNTLYPFIYACRHGERYDSYEYLCK